MPVEDRLLQQNNDDDNNNVAVVVRSINSNNRRSSYQIDPNLVPNLDSTRNHPKYHRIHKHCLNCIKPLKCIRKPPNYYHNISSDELYSLILNVNYQDHHSNHSHHSNKLTLLNGTGGGGDKVINIDATNGNSLLVENGQKQIVVEEEEEEVYDDDDDPNVEICPVVKCTNQDCPVITHYCKLQEHYLLCHFQKVPCLNCHYGCPFMVLRKDISQHLKHCPANVVHCSFEWNRWPLHTTEKSPPTRVFCPPQSLDINNLDVSLALRDQRMLKQLRSVTRQMKRIMRGCLSTHPAVPIKPYIGIRTYREYTTTLSYPPESQSNCESSDQQQSMMVPTVVVHCSNVDEEKYVQYAHKLVDEAYRESLIIILKEAAKYYRLSAQKFSLENSFPTRKKSNSICQMTLTAGGALATMSSNNTTTTTTGLLSSNAGIAITLPSSSSINLPVWSDLELFPNNCQQQQMEQHQSGSGSTAPKQPLPPPPPPIPKCNTLSLEIPIRSFAFFQPKPRAMYTFRCGLDFRRDESASHYHDIHSHIHGGLDGWIEHRCPLFQYGCNFVHRRWSPNCATDTNRKTLVYNEVLETFACTSLEVITSDSGNNNNNNKNSTGCNPLSSTSSCQSSSTSLDPDSTEFITSLERSHSGTNCSSPSSSTTTTTNTSPSSASNVTSPNKQSLSTLSLLSNCSLSSSIATQNSITINSSALFNNSNHLIQYSLNDFPFEILQNICYYLDGYSLNNLSFTSHRFRAVVQSFLKRKGYVLLQWIRFQTDDGKHIWRATHKKWQFSTAIEPIEGWSLDSDNVIGEHLHNCPFNDRHYRTEPFRLLLPVVDTSLKCKKEL